MYLKVGSQYEREKKKEISFLIESMSYIRFALTYTHAMPSLGEWFLAWLSTGCLMHVRYFQLVHSFVRLQLWQKANRSIWDTHDRTNKPKKENKFRRTTQIMNSQRMEQISMEEISRQTSAKITKPERIEKKKVKKEENVFIFFSFSRIRFSSYLYW